MTQTAAEKKTPAPKKAAPKKPTDRKVKGESSTKPAVIAPEETPGWDLLRSFEEVPVWDQMPLIALLDEATSDETQELTKSEYAALTPEQRKEMKEGKRRSVDLETLGSLVKKLKDFAIDEAEYTKFCSGSGAMERSLNLAMAWVGQMGESIGSVDS